MTTRLDLKPKVSICIPTYNCEEFVEASVKSVLGQTFDDFELIIVDDKSNDDTFEVLKSLKDGRVKLFRNLYRLGLVNNWNRCLELSKGEYVGVFHQDDLMECDNIKEKVKFLDSNPGVGFVFSDAKTIDCHGQVIGEHWSINLQGVGSGVINGRDFFKAMMLGDNFVCCPSVLLRRECLEKLSIFDNRLPYSVDYEMWLRISLFYDVGYIDWPLISYRIHNKNETNKFKGLHGLIELIKGKIIALERAWKLDNSYDEYITLISNFLISEVIENYISRIPTIDGKSFLGYIVKQIISFLQRECEERFYRMLVKDIHRTVRPFIGA